ncbi:MAG: threonine synthase [bacterium]
MKFRSILGQCPTVSFREALLQGMAPDGSLYVPEAIPQLPPEFFDHSDQRSLHDIGKFLLSLFIDELPVPVLHEIVERAWNFPVPLVQLDKNLYLLELFHGPTLAFKDIGARFMALALSAFLKDSQQTLSIAVATSGDTGSAVAQGFFRAPNIRVTVLYPSGKISRLQEQQMTTLGENIMAIEVSGTFDDCQRLVKQLLADSSMVERYHFTTANSINIGRLVPQIVYYLWAIAQLRSRWNNTDTPTIVVPSGNFGNLTAAVYAQQMGAPIGGLLAATNSNDVVPRYFATGLYEPCPTRQTYSNAMDVGNPNNLARIQFLFGNEVKAIRKAITATSVSDGETLEEIRTTYRSTGRILDPHTAVGVNAARTASLHNQKPFIVAATAHPGKFPEVIERALHITIPTPPALAEALSRPKHSVRIAPNYDSLKAAIAAW